MGSVVDKYCIESETVYSVGEFCILWNHFEETMFACDASEERIIDFAKGAPYAPKLKELAENVRCAMNSFLKDKGSNAVEERMFSKAKKRTPKMQNCMQSIKCFLNNQNEEDALVGCLLGIYRIRNNMFHGSKDVYKLDEQKELFDNVNELLMYLLSAKEMLYYAMEYRYPNED